MFESVRKLWKKKKHIHLDYASTTPVRKEVLHSMSPFWRDEWANPSALYTSAVRVRRIIEESRERIAQMLRIRASGVVFTGGGTESNNLALIGAVEQVHQNGCAYADIEVLTTKIEHASILETVRELERRGVNIAYLPLFEDGRIDIEASKAVLSKKTAIISFAYVNSEIGVVQDVKRFSRMVRAWSKEHETKVLIHLDAAQAPLWLPCELDTLGIDLISLDSGKCYGPKGAGVLALRHGVSLAPAVFGGGQESGLRSGTENTALIVGCTEALIRAQEVWEVRAARVLSLRDYFIEKIQAEISGVVVNGSLQSRVANNVNISIPGIDSEYAVITLDRYGIAASTKSACGASSTSGSAVVRELTKDDARAGSTIRFTLGEETTKAEIGNAVAVLKKHVFETRAFLKTLKSV